MARGGKENFILEDLDDDPKIFKCNVCGVTFTDAKAKKAHEMGKKHEKKLNELKLKAKDKMKDKVKVKHEDDESESENSDEDLYCDICDTFFTGYISYATHIKGKRHTKNTNKKKLIKVQENLPQVLKKRESDSEEDEKLEKRYAECTTCQKEFYGPEAFRMHMKSEKHNKKVMSAKILEKAKKDEDKDCDDEEIYSTCETCEKAFSGIIPYQIHLQSKVHKKNLEKKEDAERFKDFYDKILKAYICEECKKPFSDPSAFKNHLENNSHEVRKAKNAIKDFLTQNPEIDFLTPHTEFSSARGNDSDGTEQQYYLVCRVCNVSFSGRESAEAHCKSKKHIGKVKEKKVRKLLKLKNETSSDASNSEISDEKATKEVSPDKKEDSSSKNARKNSIEEFELI